MTTEPRLCITDTPMYPHKAISYILSHYTVTGVNPDVIDYIQSHTNDAAKSLTFWTACTIFFTNASLIHNNRLYRLIYYESTYVLAELESSVD